MATPGKVYLVGAGPGHPELLTIKAAELLKAADVVVYDRLIQQEVLALTRASAERIYMGKPVDRHDSRQEEVNDLLVRKAREGKMVVRLKGGDPFLFGRGGEEAEYLAEHKIAFEVIPGVCSALSAPLSAGIAVTHRDYASAVAIVTGHQCKDDHLDWAALSGIDTLVFLMAVHNVGEIAQRLIAAGRSPETPAAMIQMAFWHDENVVTGTLATIADEVRRAQVKAPATFVIGEVVRLREKLMGAQRDLARTAELAGQFSPGPCADEVFRMATGSLGTQALAWALNARLFDRMEKAAPVCDLAHALRVDMDALNAVMQVLVALGLVEDRPDGYRNLELASQYLVSSSPQSLGPALLYRAKLCTPTDLIDEFVRTGHKRRVAVDPGLHGESCEAVARFAAPAIVAKLQVSAEARVLVLGLGAEAYRNVLRRRGSGTFTARDPMRGEAAVLPNEEFDAVVISGALNSLTHAEGEKLLREVSAALTPSGTLAVHDVLMSAGASVAPEVALARLADHIANGAGANWSCERLEAQLEAHGLATVAVSIPSAGTLAIARRAVAGSEIEKPGANVAMAH